ncbi:hypothetical protein ACTA71_006416 [Dictyostelium dimigraforme]
MKVNSLVPVKVPKNLTVTVETVILRDIYYNHFCYLNNLIKQNVDVNDIKYVKCLNYLKKTKIKPGFIFSFNQIVFMKEVGLKNLLAQNEHELKVIGNVINNISSKTMINILNEKVIALNLVSESLKNKIEYIKTIKCPTKTLIST